MRAEIADSLRDPGHCITLAANAVCCRAALETIKIIEDENLIEKSVRTGENIKAKLAEMKKALPLLGETRGLGLTIAQEIVDENGEPDRGACAKICYRCWERGLIITFLSDNVLRIQPPLVITDEETERALGESGADEKLQDLWAQNFGGLLNMEMWSIGDYPITLKKLLLAVLLFFAGFFVTRFASARAKKHFEKAGTLSKHSLILVQNLVFYAGVIFSFLLTLWTLRIPLTAFAFMGGAAAIAIGLGMQKLMGDMIAGILLFFQKKIRIGDRIGDEVIIGGTYGIVSEITLQNTVLICQQTRHLIIPNSKMLDSSVLNLTLNNSISRYDLEVSIDYESDVEKAMALIRTILSENRSVLKTPPFRTVVSEFEDSGIQITAYFFIDLSRTIESSVKSELRLRILEAFRENGIEMPYPQVDVHMRGDSDR